MGSGNWLQGIRSYICTVLIFKDFAMIQRVQTIYLLLAFTCIVLLIWLPLFSVTAFSNEEGNDAPVSAEFGAYGLRFVTEVSSIEQQQTQYNAFPELADNPKTLQVPIYSVFITMSLLTMTTLLLYKKRKRQLLWARLTFIIHVMVLLGIVAFYYWGVSAIKSALPLSADFTISFDLEFGFYLLLMSTPFLFLAIRGIKQDENLVKSLERLR